jgi:hypothetical protein
MGWGSWAEMGFRFEEPEHLYGAGKKNDKKSNSVSCENARGFGRYLELNQYGRNLSLDMST